MTLDTKVRMEDFQNALGKIGFWMTEEGRVLPSLENMKDYPCYPANVPMAAATAHLETVDGQVYIASLREGSWSRSIYHGPWLEVQAVYHELQNQASH